MTDKVSLKFAAYGGAGIGLLFGVIMGTSTTPTVATVLGALTAMLAAILGLNDSLFNNAKAVRIGSFGFACVLGAYLGMFVRSHNLLSPSPEALKAQYVNLGLSEEQAVQLVIYKEFGFAEPPAAEPAAEISGDALAEDGLASPEEEPAALAIQLPTLASNQIAKQHSSMLFSAEVAISGCDELEETDSTLPLDEVINNFDLTDGVWSVVAERVADELPEAQQLDVLLATKSAVCGAAEGKIDEAACTVITSVEVGDYASLKASYTEYPPLWSQLIKSLDSSSMAGPVKYQAATLIAASLCHYKDEE